MKFTEFSLHENLQKGIENAGYVECTPVQEQVLKSIIEGRDLYVQSQTGTGKTAAYLTSVIQQQLSRADLKGKQALIMVPTRELAVQVQKEAEKLCSVSNLKCASFYGGVGYDKQVSSLKKGADILIGTPGRVIDLNQGNQMDLSNVGFLVLDEADRMFDMGFFPDLRTLIKVLPAKEKRQTMLFSATLNSYVKNLAWEYTKDAKEITIASDNITVDEIDQELLHVSSSDKIKLLLGIIESEKPETLIIFCNTKRTCEVLAKRLRINEIETEYIIGDLPQKKRLAIMERFKNKKIKCLVATDVAARGIDVNDLSMVINYDLPNEAENYVHRIGRTARAGKTGKAWTFCSEQDVYSLPSIERYIDKQIPSRVVEENMMKDDKSKDIYIKTDSYHEDKKNESIKNGMHKKSRVSKGRGRYSSKNEEAKKEYKRDRRVYNPTEEKLLASMSSEERMKIYKEKYAGVANTKASSISCKDNKIKQTNDSYKKNKSKSEKKYNNKRSIVNSKKTQGKITNESKSIFGKIKSFFGK